MARQTINIGTNANDGTGDPLRTAFDKINDNFVELYGSDNDINTLDANLNVNNFEITTGVTNGDITVSPNGTGNIFLGAVKFNGTSISSDDSTIININEALRVEGALTATGAITGSSLTLASGATATELSIDGTMAGNSDAAIPTEKAVKTYVDSQVTAQDLDFACDDSTVLSIDLDSESLQFSGGTGITTAGTANTVTIAIDGTVATLTGSQTLTNKTLTAPVMTGNVAIDNIIINDSEISTSSNAVLTLNPGGSGTIALSANTAVTGTLTSSGLLTVSSGGADITGTLITDDVTTAGNHTVSGNITTQGTIYSDRISSPATNANLVLSASGTGAVDVQSALTTIGQTITGVASITGQLNADNIRIDGNTISATTGGITLQVDAGQAIQASNLFSAEINATLGEFTTLRTDTLQNDTSDGDLSISTQGTGTVDFNTPTQTTVGPVGAAAHLPIDSGSDIRPVGYLKIKVAGTDYVIPYFNAS